MSSSLNLKRLIFVAFILSIYLQIACNKVDQSSIVIYHADYSYYIDVNIDPLVLKDIEKNLTLFSKGQIDYTISISLNNRLNTINNSIEIVYNRWENKYEVYDVTLQKSYIFKTFNDMSEYLSIIKQVKLPMIDIYTLSKVKVGFFLSVKSIKLPPPFESLRFIGKFGNFDYKIKDRIFLLNKESLQPSQ